MGGGATLAVYPEEKPMIHDSHHPVLATAASLPAQSKRRRRKPLAPLLSALVLIAARRLHGEHGLCPKRLRAKLQRQAEPSEPSKHRRLASSAPSTLTPP